MKTFAGALLAASAAAYTQTITDCEAFRDLWPNTCSGPTAVDNSAILTSTDVTALTCTGNPAYESNTWCVGTSMTTDARASTCSHNAFMCVTCKTTSSGEVRIKVQSNNMPNSCWQTNTSNPNVANYCNVDFTVTWNADMTNILNYTAADFATSSDVDTVLCDISRTQSSHLHSSITLNTGTDATGMQTWSGFGKQNIALFNGLALGNQDAVLLEGTTMDLCMSHAAPNSYAQHAHSISPCITGAAGSAAIVGSTTVKPGACNETGADCLDSGYTFMRQNWSTSHGTYGGAYGIARDGHVIYGPFNAAGETWSCDDVDLCNGFWLSSGDYAYASTIFFPYMVGCWGPAPTGHVYMPTCTTNGCGGSTSTGALSGVTFSAVAAVMLAFNNML